MPTRSLVAQGKIEEVRVKMFKGPVQPELFSKKCESLGRQVEVVLRDVLN